MVMCHLLPSGLGLDKGDNDMRRFIWLSNILSIIRCFCILEKIRNKNDPSKKSAAIFVYLYLLGARQ